MGTPNQVGTPVNFDQFFLSIDGAVQSMLVSGDWTLEGKDVDIFTIINGFAGQTLTAKKIVCKVKTVVPPTGMEFDAWTASLNGQTKTVKLQSAATAASATGKGFIRSPSLKWGVDSSVDYEFECHLTPSSFQ